MVVTVSSMIGWKIQTNTYKCMVVDVYCFFFYDAKSDLLFQNSMDPGTS